MFSSKVMLVSVHSIMATTQESLPRLTEDSRRQIKYVPFFNCAENTGGFGARGFACSQKNKTKQKTIKTR